MKFLTILEQEHRPITYAAIIAMLFVSVIHFVNGNHLAGSWTLFIAAAVFSVFKLLTFILKHFFGDDL